MIFTRRYKYDKPEIKLNGKVIEYVETFKYLGVTFDNRLTWREHLKGQIKKAKASLLIGRRLMGKHWGLSPRVLTASMARLLPHFVSGAFVLLSPFPGDSQHSMDI